MLVLSPFVVPEPPAVVVTFVVPLASLVAVGFAGAEGGRQKSSKRSARRGACMWIYVAEESLDWRRVGVSCMVMKKEEGLRTYHCVYRYEIRVQIYLISSLRRPVR